jgi:hypothetical protein
MLPNRARRSRVPTQPQASAAGEPDSMTTPEANDHAVARVSA